MSDPSQTCDSSAYFFFFILPYRLWQFRALLRDRDYQLLWGVCFLLRMQTFFLLVNNFCHACMVHGRWGASVPLEGFCLIFTLLLLWCRLLSLWPPCYFYFLNVLALVLISLYCHSDFHLILRTIHLFSLFKVGKRGIFHICSVCREVAGIWHTCNKYLPQMEANFILGIIAHSSRNLVHTSYV